MSLIEECKRYNENKPKWSLIDFNSLIPVVRVMEMGIGKYGYNNWKKGRSFTETWESAQRHSIEWKEVSSLDKESRINHLGHLIANAMFLLYMTENKPYFDDREFAEYPRLSKKSLECKFEHWKISFMVNCKLYKPTLYNKFLNDEYKVEDLENYYNTDYTPMEAILEM